MRKANIAFTFNLMISHFDFYLIISAACHYSQRNKCTQARQIKRRAPM